MFDVDADGNLLYIPDTDSDNGSDPDDGSLFDPGSDAPSQEDVLEDAPPDQEGNPLDGEADPSAEITPSPAPDDPFFTGSGNSVPVSVSGLSVSGEDITLTTSGDVYIYPDGPEAVLLAEDRSAYTASVQGLPNTTTLAYLEDVAAGYPSWYDYMCFKTDSNYAQSMCLWIGPKAEKNPSQNRIDFSGGVDCIQVNYVRSGSTSNYYYQYSKVHYDSYQIPYNSDVFLYTNVVDGYAEFDVPKGLNVAGIVFVAFAVVVLSAIFRGGGKS